MTPVSAERKPEASLGRRFNGLPSHGQQPCPRDISLGRGPKAQPFVLESDPNVACDVPWLTTRDVHLCASDRGVIFYLEMARPLALNAHRYIHRPRPSA